jgi:ParB-like chromosome segregation protein Spo0J
MSDVRFESEIVMRPINTVRPYVRNPRKNDKTVEALCKLIPKVGFNVPLVIDEKGIIVKGHARFTAAIRLGITEVPCIITHADEDAIKADRITDNKISEFSEWNNGELMQEVNEMDFDLSDIGLPKIEFGDMPAVETIKESLDGDGTISDEQKEKMYQEFKAEQEVKKAVEDPAVSDKSLEEEFGETPYYKVVCDKCGYTMFFKEGEI